MRGEAGFAILAVALAAAGQVRAAQFPFAFVPQTSSPTQVPSAEAKQDERSPQARQRYLRRVEFVPEREKPRLGLKEGMPIDAALAERVADALRDRLRADGYAHAAVEAELIPVAFHEADLRLQINRGERYLLREVRFTGQLGLEADELREALRATRARRLLPGLGPLWDGWHLLPPYSQDALEADVYRLRSLYLSRGYFDARVSVAAVDWQENKVTVILAMDAGRRYRVSGTHIVGEQDGEEIPSVPDGSPPAGELCACLLKARRQAEREGRLFFQARLEVEPTVSPDSQSGRWVRLRATVETGPVYRLGRIRFTGHHALDDATLRRALLVREADLFDRDKLRRSLARLGRIEFVQPLEASDVQATLDPERNLVHLTLRVREARRGRWTLSGPLGPLSAFGPLQFTVKSRLPAWDLGPVRLSTYNLAFTLLAVPPLDLTLALAERTRWLALVAVERPLLPGERWQSGFLLAPQLGWRGAAGGYLLNQARQSVRSALRVDAVPSPGLWVPVQWHTRQGGDEMAETARALYCAPPQPSWRWLRWAGANAADWLLPAGLLALH